MTDTLNRGYPYPTPAEDPDVPYWLQQLAESVDLDITTLLTTMGYAKGVQKRAVNTGASSAVTSAAWTMLDLVNVPVIAGRWYMATYKFNTSVTGGTNHGVTLVMLKSATADSGPTGTNLDTGGISFWTAPVAGQPKTDTAIYLWQAATTESHNVKATMTRISGATAVDVSSRSLTVHDLGAFLP